jgi:hypothetical protein
MSKVSQDWAVILSDLPLHYDSIKKGNYSYELSHKVGSFQNGPNLDRRKFDTFLDSGILWKIQS